jgi:hypothetical protein
VSQASRRNAFNLLQKQAWTKWARLYELVRSEAGFDCMRVGQPSYPANVDSATAARRMSAAATYLDSTRVDSQMSMDKFYKELVSHGQTDGTLNRRTRDGEEEI